MRNEAITVTLTVDCEQCFQEATMEVEPATKALPEGWLEVRDGGPYHDEYQFCGPECFLAWHQRDRKERMREYHDRLRARRPDPMTT